MSTAAGYFISLLAKERQAGIVTTETEQHLKHDFRKLSWRADDAVLAASVSTQIERLEKEAVALRKLRALCFGVA
jgi:hypothetical protein